MTAARLCGRVRINQDVFATGSGAQSQLEQVQEDATVWLTSASRAAAIRS